MRQVCPLGSFCGAGSARPTLCPLLHSTVVAGSAAPTDCVCEAGRYEHPVARGGRNASRTPVAGPWGNFSAKACRLCPVGSECEQPGATLGALPVSPGFWRVDASSLVLSSCNPPEVCRGNPNRTSPADNASSACRFGHGGPYCAVCETGASGPEGVRWYKEQSGTCAECVPGGVSSVALLGLGAGVVALALLLCGGLQRAKARREAAAAPAPGRGTRVSVLAEASQSRRSGFFRAKDERPADLSLSTRLWAKLWGLWWWYSDFSTKQHILIQLVQVLSTIGSVFSVPYPPFYAGLLRWLSLLNLDLFAVFPLACQLEFNFHTKLVTRTAGPLAAIVLLGAAGAVLMRRDNRRAEAEAAELEAAGMRTRRTADGRRSLQLGGRASTANGGTGLAAGRDRSFAKKLVSAAFFLIFLAYPGCMSVSFAAFRCDTLPPQNRVAARLSVRG